MSILQEYEKIKKQIGDDKWNSIDTYLSHHPELRFDQLIYDPTNYTKFDNWYYENIKLMKVEVLNCWGRDFGDIGANAILYKNDKAVANIMESYEETDVRYNNGDTDTELDEEYVRETVKNLIYQDFDRYLELPKISNCSMLLQSLFADICSSDSEMVHIDYQDWEESYQDDYTENDIDVLKEEIKKYKLENLIEVDNGEYKILCYGDLITSFNDDKHLEEYSEGMELI